MTSNRAYRNASTPESAMEELKRHIGTLYDVKIVLALEQILIEEGILAKNN